MKLTHYTKLILSIAAAWIYSADPVVSNVQASQRAGSTLVEVLFNVKDDDNTTTTATLEASSDNGETWDLPIFTLSGDTGTTTVGEGKRIIWNAGKDWPGQFSAAFRIRVTARDRFCPVVNGDEGMVYVGNATKTVNKKDSVIKSYCIDKWEYPNRRNSLPLVDVTWAEAADSCRMVGKRLCTESQWEAACAGRFNYAYPYGRDYQVGKCNTESSELSYIGDNTSCASPYGVYDLSGNAYEWTSTAYSDKMVEKKVMRGGNHYLGPRNAGCNVRQWDWQNNRSKQLGFRCCHSF
ncbi:MAG: SUMF1/EgtB/PvdO family nonheme iron enzyme [Fibrobacteres bacterium]|nr:SUMF1/EgtB/PvdO family nonheme iron enzyme [Fibrobacterota bacterium]